MTTIPEGATLPDVWQLASYRDNLLRLGEPGENPIASWVDDDVWAVPDTSSTSGAIKTAFRGPVSTKLRTVFESTSPAETAGSPDTAIVLDRWAVTAYETFVPTAPTSPVVRIDIYDLETEQVVVSNLPTVGLGHAPRVAVIDRYAITVYIRDSDDKVIAAVHDVTDLGTGSPTLYVIGDAHATIRLLDVFVQNTTLLVAYVETTGDLHVVQVDPTTGAGTDAKVQDTAAADVDPDLLVSWFQDFAGSGKLGLMVADSTNGLRSLWDLDIGVSPITTVTTNVIDSSATAKRYPADPLTGIWNATAYTIGVSTAGDFVVLYDFVRSDLVKTKGTVQRADVQGSTVTGGSFWFGANLRSKPFTSGGEYFAVVQFSNPDEPTAYQGSYYMLRIGSSIADGETMAPIATFARWIGGGFTELPNALGSPTTLDGVIYFPATVVTNIQQVLNVIPVTVIIRGVDIMAITFRSAPELELCRPIEVLDWLFVPGGTLMMFDGRTYGEASFAVRPPTPIAGLVAGGSQTDGEHLYVLVYAFTDNAGRIWRSAPSLSVSITTAAGNKTVRLTFEPLHLTGRTNVVTEIYRAAVGAPETFNRVAAVANSPFTETQTYDDAVGDSGIAAAEELYTDGGGLDNQTIAGMKLLASFDNRLWGVTFEDPETLWYTNELALGIGIVWNDVLTQDKNDERGEITALSGFDTGLAVFKGDSTYLLSGSGPNGQGQGGNYTITRVSAAEGTREPQSVITGDDGVWFNNGGKRAGFMKLSRGGSIEYSGKGVRKYLTETITSAVLVPQYNQIRWFTASGRTLVWDWTSELWSTNTEQACDSAVLVGQLVSYAAGDSSVLAGCILREDPTIYYEGTLASGPYPWVTYPQRAATPWVIASNLQGWERVYRCQGVGNVAGAHTLTANLFRNYDDADAVGAYKATYAEGDSWAWELRPRVQKLGAMKLEITGYEIPNEEPTAGFIAEAAVFVAGMKDGTTRLADTARLKPF